jgi:hypothetical protein
LECPAVVGDELEGEVPSGLGEEEDVEGVQDEHDEQLDEGMPLLDEPVGKGSGEPFGPRRDGLDGRCLLGFSGDVAHRFVRHS